jgi:hypothetical protein
MKLASLRLEAIKKESCDDLSCSFPRNSMKIPLEWQTGTVVHPLLNPRSVSNKPILALI